MIVLDTTVLVYAKGTGHLYREPCRELIAAVAEGRVEATTTVEVIQEFAHVRARRRGRPDAAALASDYAELLSPLIEVTRADLDRGMALYGTGDSLGAFDSVLVAAAISRGADVLVSADAAFSEATAIRHVLPDPDGVAGLLGPG
jgi:predicted nucleic acid-binding protein